MIFCILIICLSMHAIDIGIVLIVMRHFVLQLYMRPGGVVFEALPYFDSRHAPLVGIFPRLSAVIGLHHYTYYVRDNVFDPATLASDAVAFAREVGKV